MKKHKNLGLSMLLTTAAFFPSLTLNSCSNSSTTLTIAEDGKFSFDKVSGMERYILEVYDDGDVSEADVIADGAKPVMRQTTENTSGTLSVSKLAWQSYAIVLFGDNGDENVQLSVADLDVGRGNTLSTPVITSTKNKWGAKISLDNASTYTEKEMVTSFSLEIFSDQACTDKIVSVSFCENLAEDGNDDTYEFSIPSEDIPSDDSLTDGELPEGSELKYYAKAKCSGYEPLEIKESAWCDALEILVDGSEESGGFFPFTVNDSSDNFVL